jgi:excisionase family DNA binding protein
MAGVRSELEKITSMLQKRELIEATTIARKINVSDNTVRRWINEGKVEGYKIGGRWYVKKKSLEKFILAEVN